MTYPGTLDWAPADAQLVAPPVAAALARTVAPKNFNAAAPAPVEMGSLICEAFMIEVGDG